jgi:hypothetical protein
MDRRRKKSKIGRGEMAERRQREGEKKRVRCVRRR